jgi:CheY-like chemotaxis protein/HPt (histidine-containing phosphotransfer) domain-containing protein
VDVAGGGPEAIALVTAPNASYNIIFMDIQMPEMDGVAATAEIRRLLGKACPPVVAMTAYSMQEDAGRFMRQGLDDYVGKPVKSRHLYEVLHRWLRPRQIRAIADLELDLDTDEESPQGPATAPGDAGAKPAPVVLPVPDEHTAKEPILDEAVVVQLLELGGAEFTTELYQEFEQEAGDLLREAAPVAKSANLRDLLPMLHQLKGTAATLGGVALAAQARQLEHELKEGRMEGGAAGFQLLEHYFVQFVAEYPGAVERAANAAKV